MGQAAATIEGTYSVPVITHVCLETHGLVARWDGDDKMTVWASTQNVDGVECRVRPGVRARRRRTSPC